MPLSTAVFFDFENYVLSSDMDAFIRHFDKEFLEKVKNEASDIAFMKAYADWSMPRFRAHAQFVIDQGIDPVQVFGYSFNQDSKNIADFIMTLDILETALNKPYIENFVIVTGDAGFSVIINRLRALGKRTILYRPNENCSRYLERLADVCLCLDFATMKNIAFLPPVSETPLVLETPFSPSQLPEEDKTNVRIMQPEFLRKFEEYGIAPTRENVSETIISILRVLTALSVYDNNPFTVISVSRLSAVIDAFVINFNFRNYGHKTITKYLNEILKGTPYSLARRSKDSQYYVIADETALAEAYPKLEIKYDKQRKTNRSLDTSHKDARQTESVTVQAADVNADKPEKTENNAQARPLAVNIAVPPSNRTIIIARAFSTDTLPETDKQNARIMQPKFLKTLEAYGLVKYGELSKDSLKDFIIGTLKILASQNLYPQHPQIVASLSLITLMLEQYIEGFSAKKYGFSMLSRLVETLTSDTEFKIVRRDNNSQFYIIISEKGLSEIHPDVTIVYQKNRPAESVDKNPPEQTQENAPPISPEPAAAESPVENEPKKEDPALKPQNAAATKKVRINDYYVRHTLSERIKKGKITDEEINKLTEAEYCLGLFNTPLSLLKEVEMPLPAGSELDESGKKVYWKRVFRHNERYFLIYGDWKDENQKAALIKWADDSSAQ